MTNFYDCFNFAINNINVVALLECMGNCMMMVLITPMNPPAPVYVATLTSTGWKVWMCTSLKQAQAFLLDLAQRGIGCRLLGTDLALARKWVETHNETFAALVASSNGGVLVPTSMGKALEAMANLAAVRDLLPMRSRGLAFNRLPLVDLVDSGAVPGSVPSSDSK